MIHLIYNNVDYHMLNHVSHSECAYKFQQVKTSYWITLHLNISIKLKFENWSQVFPPFTHAKILSTTSLYVGVYASDYFVDWLLHLIWQVMVNYNKLKVELQKNNIR